MSKLARKLLQDKRERLQRGLFWVDGVNFVYQAKENGWEIEKILYVPELIDTDFKKKIINEFKSKLQVVSRGEYQQLSSKNDLQGVGALVKIKEIGELQGATLVLENISNPGNLGSSLRAAAGFGIKTVITIQPCVDFWNPDVVRASMGALFHLNLISFKESEQVLKELKDKEYDLVALSPKSEKNLSEIKEKFMGEDKIAIWFGNEAKGLSRIVEDKIKEKIKIETTNKIDSLNLAESVAVALFSLFKV